MIKVAADDLTFVGTCKEGGIIRYLYVVPDAIGEALASPDRPPCDGIYALVVIRDSTNHIQSVRLYVEDKDHPVETELSPGTDYDMENIRDMTDLAMERCIQKG